MTLYLVLTAEGWVQVFAAPPTQGGDGFWRGRLIFPLDPWGVARLRLAEVLRLDVPQVFRLQPLGAARGLVLVRPDADTVLIFKDWILGQRFCWRATRWLNLQDVPIGQCMSFEPEHA